MRGSAISECRMGRTLGCLHSGRSVGNIATLSIYGTRSPLRLVRKGASSVQGQPVGWTDAAGSRLAIEAQSSDGLQWAFVARVSAKSLTCLCRSLCGSHKEEGEKRASELMGSASRRQPRGKLAAQCTRELVIGSDRSKDDHSRGSSPSPKLQAHQRRYSRTPT